MTEMPTSIPMSNRYANLHPSQVPGVLEAVAESKGKRVFLLAVRIGPNPDKPTETVVDTYTTNGRVSLGTSHFTPSGDGTSPDFTDPEIIDYGQTLRLGPYEASAEAIWDEAGF